MLKSNVGAPQVAYRETIRTPIEQEAKYIKQSGGRGQYGHVKIRIEPLETGGGFEFVDKIKGGIDQEKNVAVLRDLGETMENGVIGGFPVVDVKVTLYDGSFHDVDSSEMAFKIAGSYALKDGAEEQDLLF